MRRIWHALFGHPWSAVQRFDGSIERVRGINFIDTNLTHEWADVICACGKRERIYA